MKVIFVNGSEDYDALNFENNCKADLETWNTIKKDGVLHFVVDEDVYDIECEALEFKGDIDPEFVKFMKRIFGFHKSIKNFYIVRE